MSGHSVSGKNLGQITSSSLQAAGFGFGLWERTRMSENTACLLVQGLNQVCLVLVLQWR